MIPNIEYLSPEKLTDLFGALERFREAGKILAGGTDIIPGFQQKSARFQSIRCLLDVNWIAELKIIQRHGNQVVIGSAVTFSDILKDKLLREYFPLLVQAAAGIGSVQIRNRATIAGNFVNNAPCADSVPALLVYDAKIRVQSADEKKDIALAEFLIKPYRMQLSTHEVVTQVRLPLIGKEYQGDFYKLGRRRAVAISRITLAVVMKLANSHIEDIRIASGAVTPIGKRFAALEDFGRGKQISAQFYQELAQRLGQEILEATGLRWSSAYKLPVAQQMFYQQLQRIHFCGN